MKKEIYKNVAKKLNLSPKVVEKVYCLYWRYIKEYIASLPLKEALTVDEFNALQKNINLPNIGKLNVTLDRFKKIKNAENKKYKTSF